MLSERIVPNGKILGLNIFPVPEGMCEWKNGVWDSTTDGFVLMASCLKYANSKHTRYKWKNEFKEDN